MPILPKEGNPGNSLGILLAREAEFMPIVENAGAGRIFPEIVPSRLDSCSAASHISTLGFSA
jgi:hypothetical protein